MTVLGYDQNGTRIENSWGTRWGDSGWFTLSWDWYLSTQDTYRSSATEVLYMMHRLPPPPTPTPTPTPKPVLVSPPSIKRSAVQGSRLTAAEGAWTNATGYANQWQTCDSAGRSCRSNGGASASYMLPRSSVGHRIRVVVTATSAGGSTAAGSATTSAVQAVYATPNLQGRTLAAAKALLQRAHMTLASVTKPKHVAQHHTLHVY